MAKKKFTTPNGLGGYGGTRTPIQVDDEIAYPLISDEYSVIKEQIHTEKLDNWQTLLLSAGITFLVAAIISLFTYTFFETVTIDEVDKEIPIINSFIIVGIYILIFLAAIISFWLSFKYTKKLGTSFQRIDKKILEILKTK